MSKIRGRGFIKCHCCQLHRFFTENRLIFFRLKRDLNLMFRLKRDLTPVHPMEKESASQKPEMEK